MGKEVGGVREGMESWKEERESGVGAKKGELV